MLPGASPTAAEKRTSRLYPPGAGLKDFDGPSSRKAPTLIHHLSTYAIPGRRERHEDRQSILGFRDAVPLGGKSLDGKLKGFLIGNRTLRISGSRPPATPPPLQRTAPVARDSPDEAEDSSTGSSSITTDSLSLVSAALTRSAKPCFRAMAVATRARVDASSTRATR